MTVADLGGGGAAIVGRDAVLDQAWGELGPPGTVLIDGPAGMGKTSVLRSLLARARDDGWLVLSCAPTESESALPLAALADLLRPVSSAVADLPAPQRIAAETVLLSSSADHAVDERVLGAATRSLLDAAVRAVDGGRVLVSVDDAPWLDPPSERALRFALRRTAAKVAILVASRTTDDQAKDRVPLGLDAGDAGERLSRIGLAPLGTGALYHVLHDRLGVSLSRPLLTHIAHDSGGNPLMAIELARAMLRLPHLPHPGEDLPVAPSLQGLLTDALSVLPPASRDAVRLASLLTVPTLPDLAKAGVPETGLDPAEEAGLLTVAADGTVEFTHPAQVTAVRAGIPPGVRRRLHRELADVVADPDERARHLARCSTAPDQAIATELASAGDRQRAQGAPELAAELYEWAAQLTPRESAERGRRRIAALRCRFDSGEYGVAGAQADAVAAELSGELRAEALLLRATVAWCAGDLETAVSVAERGLAAANPGTPLAGRVHAHLSSFVDSPESAREHAESAMRLLSGSAEDQGLLSDVQLLLFYSELRAGRWEAAETHIWAARQLGEQLGAALGSGDAWLAGMVLAHRGDLAGAERIARRHERLPRPWTRLGLARSRALMDGAIGVDPSAAAVDRPRRSISPRPNIALPSKPRRDTPTERSLRRCSSARRRWRRTWPGCTASWVSPAGPSSVRPWCAQRVGKRPIPRWLPVRSVNRMTQKLFALERYERSGDAPIPELAALPATADVRLVGALHLPADEVVLILVEGPDAETVAAAGTAAGWRPDRVSPAEWIGTRPRQTAARAAP